MEKDNIIEFTSANGNLETVELGCCYIAECIGLPDRLIKYTSNGCYKTALGDIVFKHLESIELPNGNVMERGIAGYVLAHVRSIRKIPNEIYDKAKKAHDAYMSAITAIATQISNEQPTNEQVS